MNKNEEVETMVEEKVKNIVIAQLGCMIPGSVIPEASFDNLGADELDMITILTDVEGEFNIEIPDVAAAQIFTVGDLIKYVEGRVKNGK